MNLDRLITLAVSLPTAFDASKGKDGLPKEILILPMGEHQTAKGKIVVNAETLAALPTPGFEDIAGDFNHNTVPGSDAWRGEPAAIACMATLKKTAEGIVAVVKNWTAEGIQFLTGGHYRDLSPTVWPDADGVVRGLHSFAFCRNGAMAGLEFALPLSAVSRNMKTDKQPPATAEELLSSLREVLALKADATPKDVLVALNAALAGKKETKPATDAADAGMQALTAEVESLKAQIVTLSASVPKEADVRAQIKADAAAKGIVLPAMADKLPIDQMRALAAELKPTLPVQRQTGGAPAATPDAKKGARDKAMADAKAALPLNADFTAIWNKAREIAPEAFAEAAE